MHKLGVKFVNLLVYFHACGVDTFSSKNKEKNDQI